MSTVDSVVRDTILDFMRASSLFTALDVSNKVKESIPFARHREVRDLVRSAFTTDIEPAGYARTPIAVTLDDGSTAEALLYHPLSDSWDLDNKYDAQKRAQTSVKAAQSAPVAAPASVPPPAAVAVKSLPSTIPAPAPTAAVAVKPLPASAHALWSSMFSSQPSLFPRK
jgi:hypothetical protein